MKKIIFCFFVFCFLFFVFLKLKDNPNDGMSKNCYRLANIVYDTEKSEYLTELANSIAMSKKIIDMVGPTRKLNLIDYPELNSELNIDWNFLGMQSDFAGIALNGVHSGYENIFTISSVSLTQGRNQLIIKLGNVNDLGLQWPSHELKKVKHIKDNFYFFCGF